jgi:hypothetical protein
MKFWIPVVSKWQPKQYKTLADVPEGIVCVVECDDVLLIRSRYLSSGCRVEHHNDKPRTGATILPATQYNFVRTLDPLPEPKVTLSDLPDGRCFTGGSDQDVTTVYWKYRDSIYRQTAASDGSTGCGCVCLQAFDSTVERIPLDIEMQLQDFPVTQSN